MKPADLLQQWLEARLPEAGRAWLEAALAALRGPNAERELGRNVSLASRKLGKAPLALDAAALAAADAARAGWDPSAWSVDQAARLRLLLATAADGGEVFVRRLDQLCATADLDELVAFYRGLPLYPDAPRHRARAAEGVRSNMRAVFEAVAQRNPYPAEQLPEDAWNQLVLKALFVGAALDPIVGLDRRANPALARMLADYAHERWAAKRPVSPELWRCVGPFAEGERVADLARVLEGGTPAERAAAVLALRSAPGAEARALLERHAALRDAVAARGATWSSVLAYS
ncbi:MAG: EboA domain-containing protein [Rubrivivax sp.]